MKENSQFRDLDTSFVEHMHQVATTARKYAEWILRTFSTREKIALLLTH